MRSIRHRSGNKHGCDLRFIQRKNSVIGQEHRTLDCGNTRRFKGFRGIKDLFSPLLINVRIFKQAETELDPQYITHCIVNSLH